jgi:hypothetical protein
MKAIFPDAKLLQPMPDPAVHPNISGNINSTTAPAPGYEPAQNVPSAESNTTTIQNNTNATNPNGWIFYFIGLIIILIIIIITHKKLKQSKI